MSKILLLYDTREDDLAREVKDLLTELDCDIVMIPKSVDGGRTLQDKEDDHFADAAGAIFLITPGSTRGKKPYPSPSVADEMGRAKVYFKSAPERVMYLVDKRCQVQSVDQRSYVAFDRGNMRSVIAAITGLVRNLKAAGLFEKPGKMVLEGRAYWRVGADGKREGPFCPVCLPKDHNPVRMLPEGDDHQCPVCKHWKEFRQLASYGEAPEEPGGGLMDQEF